MKRIERVTIDSRVADTPIADRYRQWAESEGVSVELSGSVDKSAHDGHTLASGKREVLVTPHRGAPVKQCTGLESDYVCCNLHVMHQTTNCPLDCSYCILQAYINQPVTTVAANVDEMVAEVGRQVAEQPGRLFRIGTGDLGDALALDPLGGVTRELVPAMAALDNVVLELKTKSDAVDQLLDLDHRGRVVVAWSINTPWVTSREEHLCASISDRLAAARRVIDAGYLVAFHFDPMIVHEGWDWRYPAVIEQIFESVPADRVAWLSMGALRFPPSMKKTMEQRFPNNNLTTGELQIGRDGKMRYIKPLRIALFKALYSSLLESPGRDIFTYLCMESAEVWRRTISMETSVPKTNNELDFRFSQNVLSRFPHLRPPDFSWDAYADAVNLSQSVTG